MQNSRYAAQQHRLGGSPTYYARRANLPIALAMSTLLFVSLFSLGCAVTGGIAPLPSPGPSGTLAPTRTLIPRPAIDFNATALAETVIAGGGFIITSTPLPVFPTSTSTPLDQNSFLATINAQFAQATETARALATPTSTPSRTPPPPIVLPPGGGVAPDRPEGRP